MQISILPFPIQKRTFRKLFPAGNVGACIYVYGGAKRNVERRRGSVVLPARFMRQIFARRGLLFNGLVGSPCFSRHRPTTLSVVRYRSNSLETGRFLLLVGALPCDDLQRPFSWIWGTTRRQVWRRFGIGLGRIQVSRRGDESVVGRPLIFVWCGSTAWIGCVNLSPS